ncbi:ATP-dependent RNA helicase HrpA [Mangrovitalea sediminis]|uniref:ATP-dependent RNA helicase HrpA n=1 Tax=Mangrovitalea sediminis TaxID=1982043 RepID=UPI0018E974B2|nr:ATP-dependent RNA helicase HrpA [Mangrovitalea sediminis]
MTKPLPPEISDIRQRLEHCHQQQSARILRLLGKQRGDLAPAELERVQKWLVEGERRYVERDPSGLNLDLPEALPVSQHGARIGELLKEHQVIVVAGETGSGKTTQLPKICLQQGRGRRGLIGHTQPRRIAARAVAARLVEEMGPAAGNAVGYQVRFTDTTSEQSLIKVMTDGILLAEIGHDRFLDRYDTLIIDEAHERSLNIDFLMGYLKRLLPKRPDLRIIITSATIEVERFSAFFGDVPVVQVSGRTWPVEVRYRPLTAASDTEEMGWPDAVLQSVGEIEAHEREQRQGPGDILVFLPGEREIRELSKALRHAELRHTEVLPLYARLSAAEQNRVFQTHGGRRIVLATNVAETSLTVPGIRYVIDTGLARVSRYSVRSKIQRLQSEPISQASANQRMGRCGRVAPGICFRLYDETDFINRPEYTDPEILRTNLASVILQMTLLGLGDIQRFPFLDAPDSRLINDGFRVLEELGAVDKKRQLTKLGRTMARLPVDPRLARMLVAGSEMGSLAEILIITAGLSVQDPRDRPADRKQAADQAHAEYADKESDFGTLVRLWSLYEEQRQALSQNQLRRYCEKRFLSWMRLREWRETHRQLTLLAREQQLRINQEPADYASVHRAILTGLLSQIALKDEKREYLGPRNLKVMIFPGSPLVKSAPKWIVAAEIVETSRVFARTVARIEPEWIEPLAAHVVKRHYFEPHWESKRSQVVGYERVTLYGLEIVSKRRIGYAQIDPVVSREIFIRRALVEGDLRSKAPFLAKNRVLLQEAESLEDRVRRRDLVIDEESLFEFYETRVPAEVVSGRHFDTWWRSLDQAALTALTLTPEAVFQRTPDADLHSAYPDSLVWDGIRYRLLYRFEPGAIDDGVTIQVPLMALRQLPIHRLDWLVPGLLREKCVALVKALPKALRKNFVPVPDFIQAALENLAPCNEPLTRKLGEELARMTGVTVDAEAWSPENLPDHLRMNVRILDSNGQMLMQGRDPAALQRSLEQEADKALQSQPVQQGRQEPAPARQWSFGSLPAQAEAEQSGMQVRVYPAIEDLGDTVRTTRLLDPVAAEVSHRRGVARLIVHALGNMLSDLERRLPGFKAAALLFAPTGKQRDLLDDLLIAAVQNHFLSNELPRTSEAFDEVLRKGRDSFWPALESHSTLLKEILQRHHEVMKSLEGKIPLTLASSLSDLKFQMQHLVFPGFMADTPETWLKQIPRYLEAALIRREKMTREMGREREFLHDFKPLWERYATRREHLMRQGIADPELVMYRWMLEEYRVSFFAQILGTSVPVSLKRLDRQWERVRV